MTPYWTSHDGRHTLYHGDCLAVLPELPAGSVELLWTDPPYGHANHDGDWNARLNKHRNIVGQPIANDDPESMRRVLDAMLSAAVRVLRPDCCCCCCCCCGGGGGPRPTFAWVAHRMDTAGLAFFHSVIWDKLNPGLGWRFRRQYEMIMVAHRQGGKLAWVDPAKAVPNIWRGSKPDGEHPNVKPLALVEYFVKLHASIGATVLDPFAGSGTTGVACIRTGRRSIMIEMEERYCEIAARRMEAELAQPMLIPPASEPAKQDNLFEDAL